MITLKKIYSLAESYNVPVEDVLFVALNIYGTAFKCDFNRMRMGVHTIEQDVFKYSHSLGIKDFYFALPINESSPFSVVGGKLGTGNGPEYDSDSYYEGQHIVRSVSLLKIKDKDVKPKNVKIKILNLADKSEK